MPYIIRQEEDLDCFFANLPIQGNVDAFLVLSFTLSAKHLSALCSLGIPSIGVDTPSLNGPTGFVGIDEEATMRSSLKALLRLGHSAIAYVGGGAHTRFSTSTPTQELAFLSAVEAENLDSSHCPVINDYKTPQEAVALILQHPVVPQCHLRRKRCAYS